MTELGKFGKQIGAKHPRELRRIDPDPPRATPKMVKKPKAAKPYGFEYQHRNIKWKKVGRDYVSDGLDDWKWRKHWGWYATAKQRDQAIGAWRKQHAGSCTAEYYGEARPIDRATDS